MSTTIGKTDLVDAIAEKAGLTKKDAASAIDALIAAIKETLKKGNKVSLVGFGTFKRKERAERMGRNPQTGEQMKIKASVSASFVPGKPFKDAIQEGK